MTTREERVKAARQMVARRQDADADAERVRQEFDLLMVEHYKAGDPVHVLVKDFGLTKNAVRYVLKREGVHQPRPARPPSPERRAAIERDAREIGAKNRAADLQRVRAEED